MIGTYEEITERMRIVGLLKNDSAIAKALELTPQALSNYKKRGKMPSSLVVKFADIFDCSLDYLFKGIGEVRGIKEEVLGEAPYLEMAAVPATASMQALSMAYNAIGLKFKDIELEPMTEEDIELRDKQLDIWEPPPPVSTMPPKEPSPEVAPDDAGAPPETETVTEESVATEESPKADNVPEVIESSTDTKTDSVPPKSDGSEQVKH